MANKYMANATMKMLGRQEVNSFTDALPQVHDILDAIGSEGKGDLYGMLQDVFLLGTIYGKREERSKRKKAV